MVPVVPLALYPASPLLRDRNELPDPCAETAGVPTLDVHDAGPAEPADESFAGREARYPSGGRAFNVVGRGGRPGDKMAVVYNVFLLRLQLDFMDRAETIHHQRALAAHFP